MKNILITILLLTNLPYSSPLLADDTHHPSATDCQSLKDNNKRLQCYDLMSKGDEDKEPDGLQDGLPQGDVGGWKIEKTQSQIDDSWNVFVSLASNSPVRTPFGEYINPSIYAVCREGRTEFFVHWGVFIGVDQTTMIQRIDSEKASKKVLTISTDSKSVFYTGNAIPVAKKLMNSKKLYLQIIPYGENAIDATFNLAGMSEALKPLRHECKW